MLYSLPLFTTFALYASRKIKTDARAHVQVTAVRSSAVEAAQ